MSDLKLSLLIKAAVQGLGGVKQLTGANKSLTASLDAGTKATKAATAAAKPAATAERTLEKGLKGVTAAAAATTPALAAVSTAEGRVALGAVAAGAAVDRQGRHASVAGRGFGVLARGLGAVAKAGVAVGAIGAVAGVGLGAAGAVKLFKFVERRAKETEDMAATAARLGIDTTTYQQLGYAFSQNSVDAGKLDAALTALGKAEVAAVVGGKAQADVFKRLHITGLLYKGVVKPLPQLLGEVADGYAKVRSTQLKGMVSDVLFAGAGKELNAVLMAGSKGLKAYAIAASSKGLVLSPETIANAKLFDENMRAATDTMKGFSNTIFASALPAMNSLIGGWSKWIDANRPKIDSGIASFFKQLQDDAPKIITAVGNVGTAIVSVDWAKVAGDVSTLATAFDWLARALNSLPNAGLMALGQAPIFGPNDATRKAMKDVANLQQRDPNAFAEAVLAARPIRRAPFPNTPGTSARPRSAFADGRRPEAAAVGPAAVLRAIQGEVNVGIEVRDDRTVVRSVRTTGQGVTTTLNRGRAMSQ